jgi:hypothetical protein
MKPWCPQFVRSIAFIALVFVSADLCAESIMPSDVWFGMSKESLSEVRSNTANIGSAPTANESHYVEIVRTKEPNSAYWYRFKDDALGAISKTIRVAGLSKDQVLSMVRETLKEYEDDFILVGSHKIVRSFNAESTLLTAQRWQKKEGGLQGYFVVSNHEITQVLFDPQKFDLSDFFLPAERLADVRENEKAVREILKAGQGAQPQSNLAPLVDLLPEATKESASAPTPEPKAAMQTTPFPTMETQSTAPATLTPTPMPETKLSPVFPIVPASIVASVILGIVVYLLRRKSP